MVLNSLLEIEDKARLWYPEVSGMKLWPAVRTMVLEPVINRQLGHNAAGRSKVSRLAFLNLTLLPKYLQTSAFLLSNRNSPRYSTAFFKTGREDGIYKYYYQRVPDPLIVESIWRGIISQQEWSGNTTFILQDTLTNLARLKARTSSLSNIEQRKIRDFAILVREQFDLPIEWEEIVVKRVSQHVKYALALQPIVANYLLPRLVNKFVFIHQACYLGGHAILVNLLHEMGYRVAEVQHGIVHQWHWAYHYPPPILSDDQHPARQYLPDIFLTFGDYWSSQIRIPSTSITIGFPKLSEAVQHSTRLTTQALTQILMVSQGSITEKMVSITIDLARKFPNYRIIFKLHPLEVDFVERYNILNDYSNVEIKGRVNVHDLIAESSIVIGEGSTVMFEALAFPGKRIFLLANDIITSPIGNTFATSEELIALIEDPSKGQSQRPPEMFWAPNWEERMTNFLHEYVPLPGTESR